MRVLPEDLAERMRTAGADPDSVHWAGYPGPEDPPVPEHTWAVIELSGRHVVGAVEEGRLATYERFGRLPDAVACVTELLTRRPRTRTLDGLGWGALIQRGEALAEAAHVRAAAAPPVPADPEAGAGPEAGDEDDVPTESVLRRGDALVRIGPDTGHRAFALTPDLAAAALTCEEAHVYEVMIDPGPDITETVAGSGAEYRFPRPMRWYADQGLLRELRAPG